MRNPTFVYNIIHGACYITFIFPSIQTIRYNEKNHKTNLGIVKFIIDKSMKYDSIILLIMIFRLKLLK